MCYGLKVKLHGRYLCVTPYTRLHVFILFSITTRCVNGLNQEVGDGDVLMAMMSPTMGLIYNARTQGVYSQERLRNEDLTFLKNSWGKKKKSWIMYVMT